MSDLRLFLEHGVRGFQPSVEDGLTSTVRRARRRHVRHVAATAIATLTLTAGLVVGLVRTFAPNDAVDPAIGPTLTPPAGPTAPIFRTGPTVEVAAGTIADEEWTLIVSGAEIRSPGGPTEPALCSVVRFSSDKPQRLQDEGPCGDLPSDPREAPSTVAWSNFDAPGRPTVTAVWGHTSSETARLDIRSENEMVEVDLFGPIPQIEADVKLFVAFHEPDTEVTLVAWDGEGRVLWKKVHPAHHSILTVDTGGTGAGGVVGYTTRDLERAAAGDQPQLVIDCGLDCQHRLEHRTEITLTAIPDAGSRFVGWTGPCKGSGAICTFDVTADSVVTAIFEQLGRYGVASVQAPRVFTKWRVEQFPEEVSPWPSQVGS